MHGGWAGCQVCIACWRVAGPPEFVITAGWACRGLPRRLAFAGYGPGAATRFPSRQFLWPHSPSPDPEKGSLRMLAYGAPPVMLVHRMHKAYT